MATLKRQVILANLEQVEEEMDMDFEEGEDPPKKLKNKIVMKKVELLLKL